MEADAGATITRHDYLPYGEELFAGIRGGGAYGYAASNLRQRFTGYERDNESGLDFAQARYYANVQGRFTSSDLPFVDQSESDPQSWNLYAYVRNNPCVNTDPSGRETCYYTPSGALVGCQGDGRTRISGENLIYTPPRKGAQPIKYPLSQLDAVYHTSGNSSSSNEILFELSRRAPALRTITTGAGVVAVGVIAFPAIGLAGGGGGATLGLSQTALPISTRLALLWSRLSQASQAKSAAEALKQISRILDEVEDGFSGIPKNPNPGLKPDGRMYPPKSDFVKQNPDGSLTVITKGHRSEIARDGTINAISKKTGLTEFTKMGAGK